MFDTKDYKSMEGVSNSMMRYIDEDPYLFYLLFVQPVPEIVKSKLETKKPHILLGDVVDAFLTDPQSIYSNCHIFSSVVGEKLEPILLDIYERVKDKPESQFAANHDISAYPDLLDDALSRFDYYNNWKLETRRKDVIDKGTSYFKELFEARGKFPLSVEVYNKGNVISKLMMEYHTTRPYCDKEAKHLSCPNWKEDHDIEVIDQLALAGKYGDFVIKGLLDRVLINHTLKEIQPIDFKTSKGDFENSYYNYRYYRQGGLYTVLLKAKFPDYRIRNFKFVVGYTECYSINESNELHYPKPQVFEMPKADEYFAWSGGLGNDGKWHNGIPNILVKYKLMLEAGFDFDAIGNAVGIRPLNSNLIEAEQKERIETEIY